MRRDHTCVTTMLCLLIGVATAGQANAQFAFAEAEEPLYFETEPADEDPYSFADGYAEEDQGGFVSIDYWAAEDAMYWYSPEEIESGLQQAAWWGPAMLEEHTVLVGMPSPVGPYDLEQADTGVVTVPACSVVCMPTSSCGTGCMASFGSAALPSVPGFGTAQPYEPSPSGTTMVTCGEYGVCYKPAPPAEDPPKGNGSEPGESGSGSGNQTNPAPQCGGSPKSSWSHKAQKTDSTGNSTFGAGYDIGASIDAKDKSVANSKGDKLEAKAWLGADVTIFGKKVKAVDVTATAKSEFGVDASVSVGIKAVGITLYSKTVKGHLQKKWSYKQTFLKASTTFVVWIIPIAVGVSMGGEVGLTLKGGLTAAPGLELIAEPFAKLYGTASGGIGVSGFSAGIAFALTFIEAKLPITAGLDLINKCLGWKFKIDFALGTLGGQLQLYIEFIWRHTLPVFSWKGYSYSWNLVNLNGKFPLY